MKKQMQMVVAVLLIAVVSGGIYYAYVNGLIPKPPGGSQSYPYQDYYPQLILLSNAPLGGIDKTYLMMTSGYSNPLPTKDQYPRITALKGKTVTMSFIQFLDADTPPSGSKVPYTQVRVDYNGGAGLVQVSLIRDITYPEGSIWSGQLTLSGVDGWHVFWVVFDGGGSRKEFLGWSGSAPPPANLWG